LELGETVPRGGGGGGGSFCILNETRVLVDVCSLGAGEVFTTEAVEPVGEGVESM
jgi:hypothetical protein